MSLLRDYSRQARTYDETRAASPSVLGPLREALKGAPGRRLADVGGGTGNYSLALRDEGWDPLVIDRQPEMLARAAAKGLKTLEGDAQRLPLADASMDAVMLVSMLHHVEQPALALAEARRVLRPGGRLALMVFTREDVAAMWLNDYFPSTRAWMRQSHPTLAELLALLPGARRIEVVYRDVEDGSLAALAGHPERLVDPRWHRQTSYFDRLERDHRAELRAGLARLRADLDAGRAPDTPGSATVLAYEQPAGSDLADNY
jgi:ubiquinone/menaquinone biosynthesis C-methylase UbiE